MARSERISLSEKLARFSERWSPRVVETLDDYEIKLVKIQGDFVWHSHPEEDELFLVLEGAFRMDFRDRQVELAAGDTIVIPRGVEHKPFAAEECSILLFERRSVANTGDAEAGALTQAERQLV